MQISVKGLAHAIKTIEKYTTMQDKLLELAYRLCEIGSTVCDSVYHTSVSVYVKRTDTGAGELSGQYDAVPSVVRPGSWSETHDMQYSRFGFWFWHSGQIEPTYETRPHPATYYAYEQMVRSIPQVAREVFAR